MSGIKIKIKYHTHEPQWGEHNDCQRIQEILNDMNIKADIETCASIWKDHSHHSAAGWLNLPEEDSFLRSILRGIICGLI